nr:hypothetical protein [Moraxella osloensis]
MKKNIIFVGAGGFFNELFDYINNDLLSIEDKNLHIKGVLDDKVTESEKICVLGKLDDYEIKENDYFIIAIGNPIIREKIYKKILDKKGKIFTYIHPTAIISEHAEIGEGCIICPNSIVNSNAVVGNNVVLNVFCSVGHDSSVGDHTVLSPYAAINGGAIVGNSCFLATRATIFPRVSIGNDVTVDSHSYAKANVDNGMIVSCRVKYVIIKNRLLRR